MVKQNYYQVDQVEKKYIFLYNPEQKVEAEWTVFFKGASTIRIELLTCFQAVSKTKSFSKAADNLYISQSSLSKKIKTLEEELGGTLFIRKSNNAVTLSPFGEYVSNYVQNVLEDYEILLTAADNYRLNQQKKLTLATFLNVAHSGILKPLTEYEMAQQNFYFETMEKTHSALKQELATHQVDVCFGYSELIGEMPDYEIIPLFSDPLILITSRQYAQEHNWHDSVSLSEVKNGRFCFPREDMEIFTFLIETCRSCGFIPQLTHSDVRLGTIRQYISAGMRCTLQFESISRSKFRGDEFVFIRLENGPVLTLSMYVESLHESRRKKAFVDYILDYYRHEPCPLLAD